MNLKQLEHLLAVSEAGSFSRAAEHLHLTQSALSRSIRLLEGEVTGHHHEIVMDRDNVGLEAEASAIADAALAIARARASIKIGVSVLYQDDKLAASLTWLLRRDLMIGFLCIEGGPVVLQHPEHDAIRLPSGVFYIGRQVESAGAEERMVQD